MKKALSVNKIVYSFTGTLGQFFLLAAISLLIWYPLRWWLGDQDYRIRWINYLLPWLASGLMLVMTLIGLRYYQRIWWQMMLAPTLVISLSLAPLFLPRFGRMESSSASLKVMSYNLCKANWDFKAIKRLIQQTKPDLLLMQELRPDYAKRLEPHLAEFYQAEFNGFYFIYDALMMQALVSWYPMTPLSSAWDQGRVQKATMEMPQSTIEIWNVHSNQPFYWQLHYQQLTALSQAIQAVKGPLIVAGDFNTTPDSETYNLVATHLTNAHQQAGWGFGFTFPSPSPDENCHSIYHRLYIPPLVRIDHIFYSHHFAGYHAETLSVSGGSDHLPIVAQLGLSVK